jgi:hypothetical protein
MQGPAKNAGELCESVVRLNQVILRPPVEICDTKTSVYVLEPHTREKISSADHDVELTEDLHTYLACF